MWSKLADFIVLFAFIALGTIFIAALPRDRRRKPRRQVQGYEHLDPYARLWGLAAEGKTDELIEVSRKILRRSDPRLPSSVLDVLREISKMKVKR